MQGRFRSGDLTLACHLALPVARPSTSAPPGLVMCHGFPVGPIDARHSAGTFPELMDRIAAFGWAALTFTFRGCGESEGNFSLQGWVDDLRAAVDHLARTAAPEGLWLVGTGGGGSLAIVVAADDPRVRGVAALAPRADFDDWASQPRRFLEHAREIGAIRDPRFPPNFDAWVREFRRIRPLDAARRLAPRPLLVIHGDDDEYVPPVDGRLVAQAHGAAELRIVQGAGHRLRHDPRAVAILLGWLERQRNAPARLEPTGTA